MDFENNNGNQSESLGQDGKYDVLIIGGGPAGASAAIYTARAGLKTLVIDKGLTAGALGITGKIANYPGVSEQITGAELLERMRGQAESFGAQFVSDKVIGVELTGEEKVVYGNQGTYNSRSVIIATGSMGRGSRVKGEDRLLGRGVSYCATCDGAFYREKEVMVAGNSDEAVEEALFLTKFASRVHFLSPAPEIKAPRHLLDEFVRHISCCKVGEDQRICRSVNKFAKRKVFLQHFIVYCKVGLNIAINNHIRIVFMQLCYSISYQHRDSAFA